MVFNSLDAREAENQKKQTNLPFGLLTSEQKPQLSGLICYGCHATWRLFHDMANDPALDTAISGAFPCVLFPNSNR